MHPLDCLVVGVDGSALSAAALDWASQRVTPGGTLHVVHAVRPTVELTSAAFQVDWTTQRRQAEHDLAGPWTEAARAAGLDPRTHLIDDDPARALLHVAAEAGASAVVIGVHGLGGRRLPLLGGVIRRLLHRATLPVIVVNAAGDTTPEPDRPGRVGRPPVVVGVGYGEASDRAVLWAADYAATRGLPLELIHAVADRPLFPVDSPVDTIGSYLGPGVDVEWAAEDLALVEEQVLERYPELRTSTRVDLGSAVAAIAGAGAGAEIVVTGKRHGARLARLTISPRLRHLLAQAPCPTAVIPSTAPVPG